MSVFVLGCDKKLQIHLSDLWDYYYYLFFFRDEKCYLIMLFAVMSAEDAPLLPDAARILS